MNCTSLHIYFKKFYIKIRKGIVSKKENHIPISLMDTVKYAKIFFRKILSEPSNM